MEIMEPNRPHKSPLPNSVSSPETNERYPTGTIAIPKSYFENKVRSAYSSYIIGIHEAMIEFHPMGCHESYKGVFKRHMDEVKEIFNTMTPEEKREFRNKIGRGR